MNRIATNLFPMMITPLNFQKGDVVKKVITDTVQKPFVGIVTAIVPSTNKVEVQWPDSMGIEDPWDLVKVNPVINPPVVKEDKFYNTYENSKKVQDHIKKLQHYNVLEDYVGEHLHPVILHAADLYNSGYSKKEAFVVISSEYDNKHIVESALDSVFNDSVSIKRATDLYYNGEFKDAELNFEGNSDLGFKVSYLIGDEKNELFFEDFRTASESFNKLDNIFKSLDSSLDNLTIVSDVNAKLKEKK